MSWQNAQVAAKQQFTRSLLEYHKERHNENRTQMVNQNQLEYHKERHNENITQMVNQNQPE